MKRNAKILRKQIRRIETKTVQRKAKDVAVVMCNLSDQVAQYERQLRKAKKLRAKYKKALDKFNKTGKVSHLDIFTINN